MLGELIADGGCSILYFTSGYTAFCYSKFSELSTIAKHVKDASTRSMGLLVVG